MNLKHVLTAVLFACIWCRAPMVHAANSNGQGHDSGHGTSQTSPSPGTAPAYPGSSDTVPAPGGLTSRHHTSANAGSSGNCDDGNAASGMETGLSGCSHSHDDDAGASSDGHSGLGWQSLLPGSIQ